MTETWQVMRTNTTTGAQLANVHTSEREARKDVFYCALDNLGMTKRAATSAANAATIGEPFALENYLFTITKESMS
jgi:hypothetical protein